MGREVRRVVPNWEHPKNEFGQYIPMFDQSVEDAWNQWLAKFEEFKINRELLAQDFPHLLKVGLYEGMCYRWAHPPDPDRHRPIWSENPTWYQLYENTTEGTPVTPPFPSEDELVYHLVNHGTFQGVKWELDTANRFVKQYKSCPTFVIKL